MVSTDIYQTGHKVQSFDVTSTRICLATRFQFQLVFVIRFELEPGGYYAHAVLMAIVVGNLSLPVAP